MNIADLIAGGEGSTIEFKSSFGNKAIETVVAFANTKGGKIVIGIDDDKITIFNPGKLINLTVDEIRSDDYQSQLRNVLVAEAFYLTKKIEKYGTGFIRIREELKTFPNIKFNIQEKTNGVFVEFKKTTPKTTPKTIPKTTPKTTLSDTIINILVKEPSLTKVEIASRLDISVNTVKEYIRKLKKDGRLKRMGSSRTGYWEVL
jgi:ATP-dependent DNA helicase RecG